MSAEQSKVESASAARAAEPTRGDFEGAVAVLQGVQAAGDNFDAELLHSGRLAHYIPQSQRSDTDSADMSHYT